MLLAFFVRKSIFLLFISHLWQADEEINKKERVILRYSLFFYVNLFFYCSSVDSSVLGVSSVLGASSGSAAGW